MKLTLFTSCILFFLTTLPEKSSKGFFYCIDHPGKTVYYSTGDVVVKKGLEETEYYQYGFMKWNGWINKSWQGLEYDLRIFSTAGFKDAVKSASDSLVAVHLRKGYQVRIVPMPYPMKPFSNYKKDGNN